MAAVAGSNADGDCRTLHIVVQNLVGEKLEAEFEPDQTVRHLKAYVSEHWGLPIICQQVLVGTSIPADDSKLRELFVDVAPYETLSVLSIYSLPYEGSIEKAQAAGDREAIRVLMLERDRGRSASVPPSLALIVQPGLRRRVGWTRIGEALIERGYTSDEVGAALQQMPQCHYQQVLEHLELSCRVIESNEAELLQWWRTPPTHESCHVDGS